MARTNPLGFRVEPEMKAALEKAAAEDSRSLTSMIIKILSDWLKDKGYLPKD